MKKYAEFGWLNETLDGNRPNPDADGEPLLGACEVPEERRKSLSPVGLFSPPDTVGPRVAGDPRGGNANEESVA